MFLPVIFLALVGKVISAPESYDLFTISSSHLNDVLIARNDATEILDGKPSIASPWFLQKVGWRNTRRKPDHFEHRTHNHVITLETEPKYLNPDINTGEMSQETEQEEKISERDAIHAEEFREKVNDPLYRCLCDSSELPLIEEAIDSFDSLIIETRDEVKSFSTGISRRRGGDQDRSVETIRKKIKKAQKILRNPEHLKENTSVTSKPLLSMAFRLNDIFIRFLAVTDKHRNICSEEKISDIINKETGGRAIFHYILRFSAWHPDVVALYLNYDLRCSLEDSPFTQEIHGLLKHLNQDNWLKLEAAYLYITVFSRSQGNNLPPAQEAHVTKLGQQFFKIVTIINGRSFDETIHLFLEDLFKAIFAETKVSPGGKLEASQLINLKFLHGMLYLMVKSRIVSYENMTKIRTSKLYPRVQAFEKAIITMTNAMKTIYAGYGYALQNLPLDLKSFNQAKQENENVIIYLTDLKQVGGNEMFPIHETTDANIPDHVVENTRKRKFSVLQRPCEVMSSSLTSSPNQKYLSSKDNIFNQGLENDLQQTPVSVTAAMLEVSRKVLKDFEDSRSFSSIFNLNALVSQKVSAEKIIKKLKQTNDH